LAKFKALLICKTSNIGEVATDETVVLQH